MYSYNPYYETYLAHYGVKGMRWGVRRYQNRDGTLTKKGREQLRESKVKAQKYKRMAIALGASAAVLGGVYLSSKIRNSMDSSFAKGTLINTIDINKNFNAGNRFYAAVNKKDSKVYKNMLGGIKQHGQGDTAYQIQREAKDKLKVAGNKNARKTMVEMYKNNAVVGNERRMTGYFNNIPQYRNNQIKFQDAIKDTVNKYTQQIDPFGSDTHAQNIAKKINNGTFDINNKKDAKKLYEMFNTSLVLREGKHNYGAEGFYKELKNKGYAGVKDFNDQFMGGGGYSTKNPVIFFNEGKNFVNKNINKLDIPEKDLRKENVGILGRKTAEMFVKNNTGKVTVGAIGAAGASAGYSKLNKDLQKVEDEHPSKKDDKKGGKK